MLVLRFSVVRLSRSDPREAFTLAMLERQRAGAPTAYPVFGRGRVLVPLPQKDLTPENIEEVCAFLTGECSCQVKEAQIGWDLLVQCNWDEELERVDEERHAAPPVVQSASKPEMVAIQGRSADTPAPGGLSWTTMLAMAGVPLLLAGIFKAIWGKKQP